MRDTSKTKAGTVTTKLEAYQMALAAKIERLRAQAGDVVIVKPAGEDHRQWSSAVAEALAEHLGQFLGDNGLMLIIPPGADIEVINEAMMEKHGWVRAENCSEFPGRNA